MVVTRGNHGGGVVKVKWVKFMVIKDLTLGDRHKMHYTDGVS